MGILSRAWSARPEAEGHRRCGCGTGPDDASKQSCQGKWCRSSRGAGLPESEALGGQKRRGMRDRLPPGGQGGAGRGGGGARKTQERN